MRTKIKRLTGSDFQAALELYAEACHADRFYCKLFATDDCYSDIKKTFHSDVWATIQFGHALGAFAGKQLIGVLLGFNVLGWFNSHRKEFNHVFNFNNAQADYWYNTVTQHFKEADRKLMYIYMIGVDEQFRKKGVATLLIKKTVDMYQKEYTLISDASNPIAMPMWLSNGFKEIRVGSGNEEVLLVSR
ncbi:MAG: GNAT family N-acetyltransferase [Lachnospiraceae bacterium]|nr:GNAT family N-acetyltransferase [Lachnospiraceae bacterium]